MKKGRNLFIIETMSHVPDELMGQRPIRTMWGPYHGTDAVMTAISEFAKQTSISVVVPHSLEEPPHEASTSSIADEPH